MFACLGLVEIWVSSCFEFDLLKMAEISKVRLVRCPKCENLLPELQDYSVYQCGGCGAVLRGKKGPVIDGLLEKSDDEIIREGNEKGGVSFASASERENDDINSNRGKERVFPERGSSSSSKMENREVLADYERIRRGDTGGSRSDQSSRVGFYDNKSRRQYRVASDNDLDLNMNSAEFASLRLANEVEEIRRRFGSVGSWPVMDQWGGERNGSKVFRANGRGVTEQERFATSSHPDVGTSYDPLHSSYSYGEQVKSRDGLVGLAKVESLENDRAELLRKLDELQNQLSRSYNAAEQPKGRIGADRGMTPPLPDLYSGRDASMPESSTSLYNANMKPHPRDKHVPKPPYHDQNLRPFPYGQSYALDMQDFHTPIHVANEFMQYEDAYRPQLFRRPPFESPHQYLPRYEYRDRFPGQYMDFNQALASLPHETFFHQPACSCFHCYNKNWHVSPKVRPPVFSSQRSPNDPSYRIYHQNGNPVTYGPPDYNTRGSALSPLRSLGRHPHTRSLSDLDLENGGFGRRQPRRLVLAHGSGRVFYPVAGGAPFVACCNCFELLKLPRKVTLVEKKQQKIRCGACSTIILFELDNKGFVFSVPAQVKIVPGLGSAEILDEKLQSSPNRLNARATNSCSDDFDSYGYNFQTANESNLLSEDQNLGAAERRQESRPSSSSFSEDEESPDSVIVQRAISSSVELPSKDNVSLPLPDSPVQEHPDNTSDNAVSKDGKGSKSKRSYLEKLITSRATSRQSSVKDVAVATEMEVSFNEYLNSGVSQDSAVEVSNEEDQSRTNKRSESFFTGLIKKGFRDFSRSSQNMENGKSNVYVNGQLIPDRVVKKAEKHAGTIQPGEYWYDFRAGFWGVMGQPCLGIIPPFIEEFNYRMPESCAAGNTGVFVNGRELHQRDLDLLSARGLPVTKDKSYIIEINGKVLDENTGEELESLGKLAPTVERANHGFGMKVPRVIAR